MPHQPKIIHGFTLNLRQADGGLSIFIHRVFPDAIVSLTPAASGGTDVKLRASDGEEVTIPVVQSPELIQALMDKCRGLDQECAGSSPNEHSDHSAP